MYHHEWYQTQSRDVTNKAQTMINPLISCLLSLFTHKIIPKHLRPSVHGVQLILLIALLPLLLNDLLHRLGSRADTIVLLRQLNAAKVSRQLVHGLHPLLCLLTVKHNTTTRLQVSNLILDQHGADGNAGIHLSFAQEGGNRGVTLTALHTDDIVGEPTGSASVDAALFLLQVVDKLHGTNLGGA